MEHKSNKINHYEVPEIDDIPEIEKFIGRKIKFLRQLAGKNQSEVASLLGITFQQLQKYETGKNKVPVDKLLKLCQVFKVKMEVFFEGSMNVIFNKETKDGSMPGFVFADKSRRASVKERIASIEGNEEIKMSIEEIELLESFKKIGNENLKRHIMMLVNSIADQEQN